jgi:hypothetical protein
MVANNPMNIKLIIAFVLVLFCRATCIASTALPVHAAYFANGLGDIHKRWATILDLMNLCIEQPSLGCKAEVESRLRNLPTLISLNKEITVFGSNAPLALIGGRVTNAQEVFAALTEQRSLFMKQLQNHEIDLLARFAAVLGECRGNIDVRPLTELRSINFKRFWQQSEEDLQSTEDRIEQATAKYLSQVRAEKWSAIRCVKTRELGIVLVRSLDEKLAPYRRDGWERFSANNRFGQAGGQAWDELLAFETIVRPEVVGEIDRLSPPMKRYEAVR